MKTKAHGLHFGDGIGIKRVDLNINIDKEKIMEELEVFCTRRFEIYKGLSKELFTCWVKESKGCNES